MAQLHEMPDRPKRLGRLGVLVLAAVALAITACSPEDGRPRGELGADVGNTSLPIQMHGGRGRNNPSHWTPEVGRAPRDAKGVPGWWAERAE